MAANLKISQLNAAETLTGAELIECVQDGANVQTTTEALAALCVNGTPTESVATASTHKVAITINGETYYILLTNA